MKMISIIFTFALIIPFLLPEKSEAPVRLSSAEKVATGVSVDQPIRMAKASSFQDVRDLYALVNALTVIGSDVDTKEGHCLAQAVYFEARSEPIDGQLAVAQVVLNRVKSPYYPDTICGVVFQNENMRHRCQFSFACDGLSDNPYEADAWNLAERIAYIALSGRWKDITKDATHYHAVYVNPSWANNLVETGQHGSHIFYRDGAS